MVYLIAATTAGLSTHAALDPCISAIWTGRTRPFRWPHDPFILALCLMLGSFLAHIVCRVAFLIFGGTLRILRLALEIK